MRTGTSLPSPVSGPDYDPEADALLLLAEIARTVAVTHALVASQRHVDIVGLKDQVGLLCAKALDLPPPNNKVLKLELKRLASGLDALDVTLRANAA